MYKDKSITESERLQRVFHLHPIVWARPIAAGVLSFLILLASTTDLGKAIVSFLAQPFSAIFGLSDPIGSLVLVAMVFLGVCILGLIQALKIYFIEQFSTGDRLIRKWGVIACMTDEIFISRIESVSLYQSWLGRFLGYGHIVVTGVGSHIVVLSYVTDPLGLKKSLEGQIAQ